jgi:hypothetical protein
MKSEIIELRNEELVYINGGGLSELTSLLVWGVGYYFGAAASNANNLHTSTLLGSNSRPIM